MEVTAQLERVIVLIHRDSLVPALKEMGGSLPFGVYMRRAGTVYEVHDPAGIFTRCFEDRVIVVRPQHMGVEDQFEFLVGGGEVFFELPVIGLREK